MDILASFISLIVVLAVLGFVVWVLTQFAIPEPFGRIITALCYFVGAIMVIIWLLGLIGIGPGFHPLLLRG